MPRGRDKRPMSETFKKAREAWDYPSDAMRKEGAKLVLEAQELKTWSEASPVFVLYRDRVVKELITKLDGLKRAELATMAMQGRDQLNDDRKIEIAVLQLAIDRLKKT